MRHIICTLFLVQNHWCSNGHPSNLHGNFPPFSRQSFPHNRWPGATSDFDGMGDDFFFQAGRSLFLATQWRYWDHMNVSEKNSGTPKSSNRVFLINHPFWGTFIFGNIHMNWPQQLFCHICEATGAPIREGRAVHWDHCCFDQKNQSQNTCSWKCSIHEPWIIGVHFYPFSWSNFCWLLYKK